MTKFRFASNIVRVGHSAYDPRLVLFLLMLGLTSISVGCGDGLPKRVPISGKVLIDGKPLEYGFVQVIPADGRAATSEIGPGGEFHMRTLSEAEQKPDGCILGKHTVVVLASKHLNPTSCKWFAPKHYANPAFSKLELEVTVPRNDVVINLSWQGGPPNESGEPLPTEPFIEQFEDEGLSNMPKPD